MPLDPQAKAYLEQLAAAGPPPLTSLTPAEARAQEAAARQPYPTPAPVARVENRRIPGPESELPVRVYTPEGQGPFPVLVWFHGGGWVLGSLDGADATCRALAHLAGVLVVSVDYRLAPEHKFPAAVEDAYAATRWVATHAGELGGDGRRLAVGGDSAGGNLAAVTALLARERGGPVLRHQLLVYPGTDFSAHTASHREMGSDYGLTLEEMLWFRRHYLPDEAAARSPYASPLLADDLRGLPPALVITAEYDPLRDQGEAYGARLRAAGVPATILRYMGQIHGFFTHPEAFDHAHQAHRTAAAELRAALAE